TTVRRQRCPPAGLQKSSSSPAAAFASLLVLRAPRSKAPRGQWRFCDEGQTDRQIGENQPSRCRRFCPGSGGPAMNRPALPCKPLQTGVVCCPQPRTAPRVLTMAKLSILRYPDPRLHTVAKPIAAVDDRLRRLADDMLETMYDADGVGLAATQVD